MKAINKENTYLLTLAVCLAGPGLGYGNLYLGHIFLLICLILWCCGRLKSKPAILPRFSSSYLVPIAFFCWYLASILWSTDMYVATKQTILIGLSTIICLSIVLYASTKERIHKVLKVLGVVVGIELLVSLMEYIGIFRWPISPYSEMATLFGRRYTLETWTDPEILDLFAMTPTGFHWNPNHLALLFLIALPFFLFSKNLMIRILGSVGSLIVIYASNSRVALLVSVFILASAILYLPRKARKITLITGLVLVIGVFTFSYFQQNAIYKKVSNAAYATRVMLFEDHRAASSISTRQSLTENALEATWDSWGIGVGAGNSTVYNDTYGVVDGKTQSVHNFWLEVLMEIGIVPFLFLLSTIAYGIFYLAKISSRKEQPDWHIAAAGSLGLIAFGIGCITVSSAIYFWPMWILFGICIAIINLSRNTSANIG